MTQIDLELKSIAKSALRELISSRSTINWEQRRYEIAKDVLSAYCVSGSYSGLSTDIKDAIEAADRLIQALKEGDERDR